MRLPIITEEQAVGQGVAPQASLAQYAQVGAAGQDLAGAGGQLGTGIARAGAVAAHAERVLKNEDMRLDLAETMGRLKESFAQKEIEAKMRLGHPDPNVSIQPDQYGPLVAKDLDTLMTEAASSLKYPESQAAFRRQVAPYASEQRIKSAFEGLKLWNAQIEARDGIVLMEKANEAVTATRPNGEPDSAKRSKALGEGLDIIRRGVESGRYSGDQGQAKTRVFLGTVQRGQVQRDIRDPELRPGVVSTLLHGGYQYIDPDDQLKLAHTLQTQSDQEYKATREAVGKWFEEQKEMKVSGLFARAANKTLELKELEVAREEWRLTASEYDKIRSELAKPAEQPASNQATLTRVIADTHSQFPRTNERELLRLHQAGELNTKDYTSALDRLRETREGLLNRGESLQMQRHAQAEQELRASLGIPTLFDKLEPSKEKAWAAGLRELRLRSNAYGGQEDPLAVKDAILPTYRKFLDQDAQLTLEQVRKALKFNTPQDLEAARKTMTPGEYQAQKRLFLDMDTATEIQAANERAAAERKATKPGGVQRPTDRK